MSTLPTHKQIVKLIREVMLPFHLIEREIDLPLKPSRAENDVEHSWSVALLACSLAPLIDPKLDVGKISQFAIVHDLVEVFAGDTSIFASTEDLASKSDREHAALVKIRTEYSAFPWLADTIAEYESKQSNEAKFVSAVDKYLALQIDYLDHGAYLHRLGITKERYLKSLVTPTKKGHLNPVIGRYYDQLLELIQSDPHFFPEARSSRSPTRTSARDA